LPGLPAVPSGVICDISFFLSVTRIQQEAVTIQTISANELEYVPGMLKMCK